MDDTRNLYGSFLEYHRNQHETNCIRNGAHRDYFEFPLIWNQETTLDKFLFFTFRTYYEELKEYSEYLVSSKEITKNDSLQKVINDIPEVCNCILRALRSGMCGNWLTALDNLENLSKTLDLPKLSTEIETDPNAKSKFYKLRGDKLNLICENDFMHMPFDQVHNCSGARFSLPGTPCLYLGYSKSVCAAELDIDKGSCGEFTLKQSINVFDLTLQNNDKLDKIDFLLTWPLIAACYVVAEKDGVRLSSSFKQEYIFPQLLTSYVLSISKKYTIRGIRYYSCRENNIQVDENTYVNLALFTERCGQDKKKIDEWQKDIDIKESYHDILPYDSELKEYILEFKGASNLAISR